jgi:hypothetical protein
MATVNLVVTDVKPIVASKLQGDMGEVIDPRVSWYKMDGKSTRPST